jgi:hypothetical protein
MEPPPGTIFSSDLSILFITVNGALLVLIWIVQTIIYPGMHGWDSDRFALLHREYVRRISFIIVPLIVAQAALALHQVILAPNPITAAQVILIGAVWGMTFFISVPLHKRLSAGYDVQAVTRLTATNWLRTIGWSLISLLDWL